MERDSLIERRPDPTDGRSSLFSLAPRLRDRRTAISAIIDDIGFEATDDMPGGDRRRLRRVLTTIIASLERKVGA